MKFSPDNLEAEFESAIRLLTDAMPRAEELSKPTLLHDIRVGIYLYTRGYGRNLCIAGVLHDAIEDTPMTIEQIQEQFGEHVAQLVLANTKDETLKDRMEKYEDLMTRCAESEEGAIIKAADILDNYLYFSKIADKEKADWMVTTGKMLLAKLPKEYQDAVFKELQSAISPA